MSVKVVDNTQQFKAAMDDAVNRALEAIGIQAEGYAMLELENHPRRVDTSNLKNSITHSVNNDENAVYIGTNVEYGIYVHEGTVKMEANRFLKNAVEKNKGEYVEIAKSMMK
jgi:HK97 gp10 family phage protein